VEALGKLIEVGAEAKFVKQETESDRAGAQESLVKLIPRLISPLWPVAVNKTNSTCMGGDGASRSSAQANGNIHHSTGRCKHETIGPLALIRSFFFHFPSFLSLSDQIPTCRVLYFVNLVTSRCLRTFLLCQVSQRNHYVEHSPY
jgi:hypothetical protein